MEVFFRVYDNVFILSVLMLEFFINEYVKWNRILEFCWVGEKKKGIRMFCRVFKNEVIS